MASNDEVLQAGKYELLAQWDEMTSKPGQPFEFVRHAPSDVVQLSQEDANRLRRVIVKPGARERAAAARLRAQADAAQAAADAATERAKAADKDARSAARGGSGGGPDEKPAGNASLEDWRTYALANGATEADLEGKTRDEVRDLFAS